jgi:hypothetical protein
MINKKVEELLNAGEIIMVGEMRTSEVREINWMNQATGKQETFVACQYAIESTNKTRFVVDDGLRGQDIKAENFKSPFKKGMQVVVSITKSGFVKGRGEQYRGIIHPLLDTPAGK